MSAHPIAQNLINGIQRHAGTAIGVGSLLIVVGAIAIASPLAAGVSIMLVVGVLLIGGGIGQCLLAFKTGTFGSGVMVFILGALTTVAGIFMVAQPVAALAAATLVLAIYLIFSGIIEGAAAIAVRSTEGWRWLLASGIVSFLLGLMLWRQYPLSGTWAVGALLGIRLVMHGATLVILGRGVRRTIKDAGHSA